MTKLSAADRRALRVGALVIVVAVVGGRLAPWWWRVTESAVAEARAARQDLADARALVSAEPLLMDSLAVRRARLLRFMSGVLLTPRPAAAASQLGAIVTRYGRESGILVSSLSVEADTLVPAGFGRPVVRLEGRGDVRGLTRFLASVENGPARLTVRELTVTQPDPVGAGRPEDLRLALVIEGIAVHDATADAERRAP